MSERPAKVDGRKSAVRAKAKQALIRQTSRTIGIALAGAPITLGNVACK